MSRLEWSVELSSVHVLYLQRDRLYAHTRDGLLLLLIVCDCDTSIAQREGALACISKNVENDDYSLAKPWQRDPSIYNFAEIVCVVELSPRSLLVAVGS